jgi:hypothetical protein
MLKALILVAATLSEHWVCATPVDPATNPAYIFLHEFEVEGDELVQKSRNVEVTIRHRILRNDDQRIIFEWMPGSATNLAVIEKRAVFDPSFKVYPNGKISADGNVEGKPSSEGTCDMFQ